jgi:nitrite reductase/ring-hydroxylating ferredoxin subunit
MTVGVLAAVPTALAGFADWADAGDEPRRVGFVHAALNTLGLGCMVGSLFARRADQRGLGIGLSTTGLALATVSAWLGGDLVYRLGTNVRRIAFQPGVPEFQVVARADELQEGKLTGVQARVDGESVPIVLLKRGATVMAISGTCTHWGGPLAEGKLVEGDCVECPWHGTQFSMADGSVKQGPGAIHARVFETRIRDGNVEVRSRD